MNLATDSSNLQSLTYEQAFAELEQIVSALESNERPLNEALALYERGQSLIRLCIEMLDNADLTVQTLSGDKLVDFKLD